MSDKKIKASIYVGCALTESPDEFKTSVEEFKERLRIAGYEVFDFVGLVAGTPKDVYEWDMGHCVADSQAFIAICDYPAIGLGYELNEATRLKKPVLALAQKEAKVTRLILGAAEKEANIKFDRYSDLNVDGLKLSLSWLRQSIKF